MKGCASDHKRRADAGCTGQQTSKNNRHHPWIQPTPDIGPPASKTSGRTSAGGRATPIPRWGCAPIDEQRRARLIFIKGKSHASRGPVPSMRSLPRRVPSCGRRGRRRLIALSHTRVPSFSLILRNPARRAGPSARRRTSHPRMRLRDHDQRSRKKNVEEALAAEVRCVFSLI